MELAGCQDRPGASSEFIRIRFQAVPGRAAQSAYPRVGTLSLHTPQNSCLIYGTYATGIACLNWHQLPGDFRLPAALGCSLTPSSCTVLSVVSLPAGVPLVVVWFWVYWAARLGSVDFSVWMLYCPQKETSRISLVAQRIKDSGLSLLWLGRCWTWAWFLAREISHAAREAKKR